MAAITREFIKQLRAKHSAERWGVRQPIVEHLIRAKVLEDVGRTLVEWLPVDDKVKADVSPLFTPIQRSMVESIHAIDVAETIKASAPSYSPVYQPLDIENIIDMFMAAGDLHHRLAGIYVNSSKSAVWKEAGDRLSEKADLIKARKMPLNPFTVIDGNRTLWNVSTDYIKVRLGNSNYTIFIFRYKQAYEFLNEELE